MTKNLFDGGKISNTLSDVKPVEKRTKNPQSFLKIVPIKWKSFLYINSNIMDMSNKSF